MASQFTTLADLWRANADIIVKCGGCGKYSRLQLHQISASEWADQMPPAMEAENIEGAVARLKCSKCGGRVDEWWPDIRLHNMATG